MTTDRAFEQFVDRLGLRHFAGREFTAYWSRSRAGVRNARPPERLWPNVVPTLLVLDALRERLGYAITLTSTYRQPAYNRAVGGAPRSHHLQFRAVDFRGAEEHATAWWRACAALRGHVFAAPGGGNAFRFRGGLGRYVASDFVHVDTRGVDADWSR